MIFVACFVLFSNPNQLVKNLINQFFPLYNKQHNNVQLLKQNLKIAAFKFEDEVGWLSMRISTKQTKQVVKRMGAGYLVQEALVQQPGAAVQLGQEHLWGKRGNGSPGQRTGEGGETCGCP